MNFNRFVGIDWSGARGARQAGIQVAEIKSVEASPRLIDPPSGKKWGRCDVLNYIVGLNEPTLVGIDFAFSIPSYSIAELFRSERCDDVRTLWARVDCLCEGSPHLYAGPVWRAPESPFLPYIFHHQSGHPGALYRRDNLREVDRREGKAISIFHMVGPQVGAGSFAGMRMLHQLTTRHGDRVAIWPFDDVDDSKTTVVEVYPSFLYRMVGATRPTTTELARGSHDRLEKAVRSYEAKLSELSRLSVDQADALISAVALRRLARRANVFEIPARRDVDPREGWIFGFPLYPAEETE